MINLSGAILWISSLVGAGLSVGALVKICSSCSETAAYRVFGMEFGWFGIGFFALLLLLLSLRKRFAWCSWSAMLLLFAAAGAETRFIWIQKYEIGQWCPVCLSLAAMVFLACVGMSWELFHTPFRKGAIMKSNLLRLAFVSLFFITGLGVALIGVDKQAEAADSVHFLGKSTSPTTVYFVSDWFCPACRSTEPTIEKLYPELARSVKIGFVDFPIHRESTNFTPFNLQFLTFEKAKYIPLRKALSRLALKTKSPTEAEVQAAVAHLGVKLRPINYADTLYGMQANLAVYRGFNVHSTPTLVVTNKKSGKTKLLVGGSQINREAVKAAISEVEKG